MLGKTFHVVPNCLNSALDQAQCNLCLYFLEVEEQHPAGVVLHNSVSLVCMDNEVVWIHSLLGMVQDWPYHLEYIQGDIAHHPTYF